MRSFVYVINLLIPGVARTEGKYKVSVSVHRIHRSSCRSITPLLTKENYFLSVFKNYGHALTQYSEPPLEMKL